MQCSTAVRRIFHFRFSPPTIEAMVKTLPPIETNRLYQKIADVLRASITDDTFPVGSYLPPERDLATQLAVSRSSIREALIALEVQGCVAVKVGAGVQVLRKPDLRSAAARTEIEPPIGPLDLLAARLVIEVETAALAAVHAVEADVARLERALAQMIADHARGSTRHKGDRNFHLAIATASGNAAMAYLLTILWERRPTALQKRLETLFSTSERFTAAVTDHKVILAAIRAQDPAAAREAMQRHLTRVRDAYSRAIDSTA